MAKRYDNRTTCITCDRPLTDAQIREHRYKCWTCRRAMNPNAYKGYDKVKYDKQKQEVFDHYGYECAYCGAKKDLHVDHINGDGKAHRGKTKLRIEQFLVQNNFPAGYQILCRQCNIAKQQMTDAQFRKWITKMYRKIGLKSAIDN